MTEYNHQLDLFQNYVSEAEMEMFACIWAGLSADNDSFLENSVAMDTWEDKLSPEQRVAFYEKILEMNRDGLLPLEDNDKEYAEEQIDPDFYGDAAQYGHPVLLNELEWPRVDFVCEDLVQWDLAPVPARYENEPVQWEVVNNTDQDIVFSRVATIGEFNDEATWIDGTMMIVEEDD